MVDVGGLSELSELIKFEACLRALNRTLKPLRSSIDRYPRSQELWRVSAVKLIVAWWVRIGQWKSFWWGATSRGGPGRSCCYCCYCCCCYMDENKWLCQGAAAATRELVGRKGRSNLGDEPCKMAPGPTSQLNRSNGRPQFSYWE